MHTTSKQIELESPGYSGFEENWKLQNLDFLAQLIHLGVLYIYIQYAFVCFISHC